MNAATRPMIRQSSSALDDAVADPEVRAIVLTGDGRGFWHLYGIKAAARGGAGRSTGLTAFARV